MSIVNVTILTSVSCFDEHFWLRFWLLFSRLGLVVDKYFWLEFKLGGNFFL